MATVEIILDVKDQAYVNANPTKVLELNEPIYLRDGRFAFGDGITDLQNIQWLGVNPTNTTDSFSKSSVPQSFTLSFVPVFIFGVYLNGQFLNSSLWGNNAGVVTVNNNIAGDLSIVYSNLGVPVSALPGSLFNFTYSPTDWQEVGGLTVTYGVDVIRLQGTNFPNQNNYVHFTGWYSDSEEITFQIPITFNSDGPTDYGASIKMISNTVGGQNLSCLIGGAAGVNQGQMQIYSGPSLLSSIVTLPIVVGDTVLAEVVVSKNYILFKATNLRTSQQAQTDYTFGFDLTGNVYVVPPLKSFGVGSSGGDYFFSNLSVNTSSSAGCDLMMLGDSRMYGLFAGGFDPSDRVIGLWQSNNPTKNVLNNSGSGERTTDFPSKIQEILLFAPKKVIVFIGINDALGGIPDATIVSNIQALRTQLLSIGCEFFLQLNTPCTAIDVTALNNACIAAFPPAEIIPVPVGWDPVLDNEDSVHPNAGAQIKIYQNQSLYVQL